MAVTTKIAHIDYFRCCSCEYLWTEKQEKGAERRRIALRPAALTPGRSVPVHCTSCRKPASLEYAENGAYRLQRWICLTCGQENRLNTAGRIVARTTPSDEGIGRLPSSRLLPL